MQDMQKRSIITVPQLFSMLFISKMVFNLTYTPMFLGTDSMWANIISNLLAFVILFIMVIPIYKSCDSKHGDISDNAYSFISKKAKTAIAVIYALYYLFVVCYTLSSFSVFVTTVANPDVSLFVLCFSIVVVSLYASFKGLEGLARASSIILVLVAVSLMVIVISIVPKIDNFNYSPIIYYKVDKIIYNTILIIANTPCIPALAMLIPFAKGDIKKGFKVWNLLSFIVVSIFIIIIVGSLGDFLKTQMFPFYTATSIAKIGQFKRMDAIYLGIWTCALFVKISLFLYLFYVCVRKVFTKKTSKILAMFASLVAAIFSITATKFKGIFYYIYKPEIMFVFTIITALVVPGFIIISKNVKANGEKKYEN